MADLLYKGQWRGFFKYGSSYGPYLNGQEAEFRLFVEEYENGNFLGRVIDWDGIGAEGEVATVNGAIRGNSITFTKRYPQAHYFIDEVGNTSNNADAPGHVVAYEGHYDRATNAFYGSWRILTTPGLGDEAGQEEGGSGTWRIEC